MSRVRVSVRLSSRIDITGGFMSNEQLTGSMAFSICHLL